MEGKKKILWLSDFSKLKTGFGRNSREVLSYLHKTGKYEIIEYATGPLQHNDPRLNSLPWKAYGSIPVDDSALNVISLDPALQERVRYGSFYIDEIIAKEKPDVFIGVNDFWAFADFYDKPWWNKFPCLLWITLDSLPIFKPAIENASKIKDFWVWSSFAEKALKKDGFDHVRTVPGAIDCSVYHPLSVDDIGIIKRNNRLDGKKLFGFVFRNQLRKQVHSLLDGFARFKKTDSSSNYKLLLHTNWSEGWDIKEFIKEFGLNNEDIVTPHICKACSRYTVKSFTKENEVCPNCGKESLLTPKTNIGLSEKQMNEVYNLIDYYIHPITSGGLEIPLVEALMAGVPIATVNYSCGEDFCEQDFVGRIEFDTTREFNTQFIKAVPKPESIKDLMLQFSKLNDDEVKFLSEAGREWASSKFDVNIVCRNIEEFVDRDSAGYSYEFDINKKYNDTFYPKDGLSDLEWSIEVINNIFCREEGEKSQTVIDMVNSLNSGKSRDELLGLAKQFAKSHNENIQKLEIDYTLRKSESHNVAILTPDELTEKLIIMNFSKTIDRPIVLIGDEIDKEIFEEVSISAFMPKNTQTCDINWLMKLKTESGENRFDLVFFKNGLIYDCRKNKQI